MKEQTETLIVCPSSGPTAVSIWINETFQLFVKNYGIEGEVIDHVPCVTEAINKILVIQDDQVIPYEILAFAKKILVCYLSSGAIIPMRMILEK